MKTNYQKFFAYMLILVLLGGATVLLTPILISVWSSDGQGFTRNRILLLLGVLFGSLILQVLFTFLRERFAKQYNKNNFKEMFAKYLTLDYDYLLEEGPTNLIERIVMGVNSIYLFMTSDNIRIWSSVFILSLLLLLAGLQDRLVLIILFIMLPINYFGYRALNKELSRRSKTLQSESAQGWQRVLSVASQTDHLKQSASHDILMEQLDPTLDRIYQAQADVNIFAQSASSILQSLNLIAQTMIMVIVVFGVLDGEDRGMTIVFFSVVVPLYFQHLSALVGSNLNKRDMEITKEFIEGWDSKKEHDGMVSLEQIDSISFDVPALAVKDRLLATNVRGDFIKGDVVWVRGESGTGKSTLVKLLVKFRTTDSLYINDIDIRRFSNRSLRSRVDYLSQNVPIIRGTLLDNLFLNMERTPEALTRLENDPVLSEILEGKSFDSLIEEGGANLSGGEKQKIAIARSLNSNAEVLILDEITSNIDRESAEEILDRLAQPDSNKIIFIISHNDLPKKYATKELWLK